MREACQKSKRHILIVIKRNTSKRHLPRLAIDVL